MRQLTIEGLRKDLDLDFSARWRSVEMTRGSLGRHDRSFVISSGGAAGVEKSASTGRVTKRPINVISAVLEHGASDEKANKCNFSRAEGSSGRAGGSSGDSGGRR